MKRKIILFLMINFISFMGLNAQNNLYDGIESGMTESELYNHVEEENNSLELHHGDIITTIKGREYIISCFFNEDEVVYNIILSSLDGYGWESYNLNVKENAVELYNLLVDKYGKPTYDRWADWTEVPDGKYKVVTEFQKETIYTAIYITEDANEYYASVFILDKKYKSESKSNSSSNKF